MKKNIFMLFLVIVSIFLVGCNKKREQLLERWAEFETGGSEVAEAQTKEKIAELEGKLAAFEEEVSRTIRASENIGLYHKLIASEYMYLQMYGEALRHLKEGITVYPVNPILYYKAGVCLGQLSLTVPNGYVRDNYLTDAAFYYNRAIELDPAYDEALYALSILYVFELDRVFEAKAVLEQLIRVRSSHIEGRFLLARVYFELELFEDALDQYNVIIKKSDDINTIEIAEDLKETVLERKADGS